ncbi:hypothetical protein GCM10025734_74030 [Kitasatospora paranensis]|uniref:hypothetical protein n=1 Tax=Kitasatospora paranensis TaxID=258053 RepID=UPI0031EC34FA
MRNAALFAAELPVLLATRALRCAADLFSSFGQAGHGARAGTVVGEDVMHALAEAA